MEKEYYNNINFDLLRFMPPDAGLVVETGCGCGALGRAYKQKNPFVHYVGIEVNEEAAETARQQLDSVATIDVERVELASILGERKVDCLVYGDVLEHLREPWSVLQRHAEYLANDGQIIACIPNVQHWSILVNLLRGQWNYADSGLLDRTHLRFFTLDSIRQMFAAAGLYVYDIVPRIIGDKQTIDRAQDVLRQAAEAVGADMQRFAAVTGALQYVVRATKRPVAADMLLHSALGEPKVCSRVRISEPHSFCITHPGVRAVESVGKVDLSTEQRAKQKVFIFQRTSVKSFAQQQQFIDQGYLTIFEMDDDPLRWPDYEQTNFMAFKSCHAVQVSTKSLAEYIRQFNPHVAIFQNQIADLPPKRAYELAQSVTLFFGAINREEDYLDIMPELNKILVEYGDKVQVTVIHDQKFFAALQTPYKKFVPFCPYEEYRQLLSKADIALLPLEASRFNSMKSDLKFIECAACGAVALASPAVYQETIQDGMTGFIYHNPDEFAAKLRTLLGSGALRVGIAKQAYDWVKNNRLLCQHYTERLRWYGELFEQYEVLTKELYQRMGK